VKFLLLGDTSNPNGLLAATGLLPLFGGGIPPNPRAPRPPSYPTPDPVTIISRQYDGWADFPTNIFAPGYLLAVLNAIDGMMTIHNDYTEAALLDNPANVTWTQGNITYELVPTQHLPLNQGWSNLGLGFVADWLDTMQRPWIESAYLRPHPSAAQLAASASEQAKVPSPVQIPGPPEPVATLNPPPTASVLASSTNRTPTPAPARATTNLVTSALTVGDLTPAPRHGGVSSVGDLTPAPRHGGVSSVEPGSEVASPRGGSDAEVTKPLTTKPAEAAVSAPSEPSLLHHSTST
jgi:PE-PPE domain